jgi:hypothetical protein
MFIIIHHYHGLLGQKEANRNHIRSVTLITAGYIIYILYDTNSEYLYGNGITLTEALDRLIDFGGFFGNFAQVVLWLALLQVGFGIFHCWDKGHRVRRILSVAAYICAGVEFLLSLVVLGGWEQYYTKFISWARGGFGGNNPTRTSDLESFGKVGISFDIILWVAAIAETGLGIVVMILASRTKQHRKVRYPPSCAAASGGFPALSYSELNLTQWPIC